MKPRGIFLVLALIASGCAHDNYSVVPGGLGSQDRISSDLKTCKQESLDAFFASRNNTRHGAALLGGAAGVAGEAAAAATTPEPKEIPASDINPMVERCMASKGYSGTSEN